MSKKVKFYSHFFITYHLNVKEKFACFADLEFFWPEIPLTLFCSLHLTKAFYTEEGNVLPYITSKSNLWKHQVWHEGGVYQNFFRKIGFELITFIVPSEP